MCTKDSKLLLDDTAITKLLISIAYFTCLASLSLRGCEHLMSLPRTFLNIKSLKILKFLVCSKILENIEMVESLDELDMSGIATRPMPSSKALFKTLKKLAFGRFKLRSPNSMGLSSTPLLSLFSFRPNWI